jgi:hypothetical protein
MCDPAGGAAIDAVIHSSVAAVMRTTLIAEVLGARARGVSMGHRAAMRGMAAGSG